MSEAQRPGQPSRQVEPSQKRGIWALVLTIFGGCCCYIPAIVGVVMAFKVLNQSEDEGRDHGRGLAIGALGVAAFYLGSGVLSLMLWVGTDLINLSSGQYGADPANADATIVTISDLHVRDCFDDPTLRGREGPLRQVACGQPHDAEVIKLIPIPAEDFPGLPYLHDQARGCRAAFGEYVGEPLRTSKLAMTYYYPNNASWIERDSRAITCVVLDASGPLKEPAWEN